MRHFLAGAPKYAAAGSFSPTDIAGCKLWLDADDAATFTYSSGTVVSQWADKSGLANHAAQATVSNQPTRNGTQNGRSTVYFDGVDNHMTGPLLTSATDNWTMFIALHKTGDSADDPNAVAPFCNGTGSNGYAVAMRANSATKCGWLRGGIAWHAATSNEPTNPVVLCLQRAAGTTSLYIDGTADATTSTAAPSTPTTRYMIGAHATPASAVGQLNGEIFEVIFYDAAIDSTDRQSVENHLSTKWGTP